MLSPTNFRVSRFRAVPFGGRGKPHICMKKGEASDVKPDASPFVAGPGIEPGTS